MVVCEGPGFTKISSKWMHGFMQLGKCFLCVFAVYQPLRSQYGPIILSPDSTCHFEVLFVILKCCFEAIICHFEVLF